MQINATIIVQAFNFFGAYLLLRMLFFKPAVKALNEEQLEKNGIKKTIDNREKKLEQTVEQKGLAWRRSQEQFAQAKPNIEQGCPEKIYVEPAEVQEPLAGAQVQKIADDLRRHIIQKVSDGDN